MCIGVCFSYKFDRYTLKSKANRKVPRTSISIMYNQTLPHMMNS